MKQKLLPLLLALSLLLTGCGWMDGRYSSVTPHLEQRQNTHSEVAVASDYLDLMFPQHCKDMPDLFFRQQQFKQLFPLKLDMCAARCHDSVKSKCK